MNEKERAVTLLYIFYYIVIGLFLYVFFRYVILWILPFCLGSVVAVLLRPFTLWVITKTHMRESIAAAIVLICFYLLLASICGLFLTLLVIQFYELMLKIPSLYAQNITPLLNHTGGWLDDLIQRFTLSEIGSAEQLSQAVSDAVSKIAVDASADLVGWIAGLISKFPILLLTGVFTIVISILIAGNYHAVGNFLYHIVPKSYENCLRNSQKFLCNTAWQMIRAYIIIMAITLSELAIGLWLLGFHYVLPVAVAITLLDILPIIGCGTVLVPWAILLLIQGDTVGGIGLLLLFAIIIVVRNIIEPKIVGNKIGLHPIVTMTSMYAGLKIAGFFGLFLAPIFVLAAKYLWTEQKNQA